MTGAETTARRGAGTGVGGSSNSSSKHLCFFKRFIMELSPSQSSALSAILDRKSGFLTGSSGTGKSAVLGIAVSQLRAKSLKVVVTATTGNAAVLIGGSTIHSVLKLFPNEAKGLEEWRSLACARVRSTPYYKKSLREIDVLVIDEASMLDSDALDVIDAQLRTARTPEPWGGVQLILCGDLCQLPPIAHGPTHFLFDSKCFWEGIQEMWDLKEIFRQRDPLFCSILQRMRFGLTTPDDIAVLKTRERSATVTLESPTRLFSKNNGVDGVNTYHLNELATPLVTMECVQGVTVKVKNPSSKQMDLLQSQGTKILSDLHLPSTISLKIGAVVMLASNLDVANGYSNGARGVVIGFKCGDDKFDAQGMKAPIDKDQRFRYPAWSLPIVEFSNGKKMLLPYVRWDRTIPGLGEAFVWHMPLRLAWATSIHRSQGQSLHNVDISLDDVFECGQAYVAISRATSLNGLVFSAFDPSSIRAHPRITEFYTKSFMLQRATALGITEG